jgi:hypothetical protein
MYIIEFIKLGTNQQPVYETQKQFIRVIDPPSIIHASVSKEYCSYSEIEGNASSLGGDEGVEVIGLPFQFNYDGFLYDEMLVSTNGWAEFGTGPMDSERGVSSEASLYYTNGFNRNLASPARPTKALAPWWDDLTLEHGGGISYETLGTEPNRTFIIQWKDIRAEFKDVNAARLNFQIQLHETTNIIEFHYGPMVYGTFAGPLVGASIGFKDHVGGDFHFYDLMAGDTGRASDLMADISPLADWPGPDSCYVIQTSPSQNIAWQIQNSGSANNLIGVDALSEQIAWIGGLNGTVLQTDDGGNTWNEVWGLSDTLHIYNIEGLDADNALVSAWSEDSSTTYIFRTNDGGLSWLSVYEQAYGFIDDITMFNQTEGVAIGDPVGGFWTILKTTDGGHTWLPIPEARAALENEYGLRNGVTWVSEFTGWVGTTGPRAYRRDYRP